MIKPLKYYAMTLMSPDREIDYPVRTKNIRNSFRYLSERMRTADRLFFVRFGDGEFMTLMRQNHRNCVYNKDLEKELEASFRIRHEDYLIACPINYPFDEFHAKGIYKQFSWQQEMIDVMKARKFPNDIVFENPCIFQCMAVFKPELLKAFMKDYIWDARKMFIGCTEKETAEKLYGNIAHYIRIPERNAYETIDEWWPEVESYAEDVDLVIPSAGSTSNVIALRLWNKGVCCKVIDFGSVVDAVDMKTSRSWIRLQGHKIFRTLADPPDFSLSQRTAFLLKDIKFYFRNQII